MDTRREDLRGNLSTRSKNGCPFIPLRPLVSKGRASGADVESPRAERVRAGFAPNDAVLASYLAIAIENAEMFGFVNRWPRRTP